MPNISVGPNITNSSQIVDGAILNADIGAVAQIALSKITDGVQGSVLVRGASGVLTDLGVGTSGQVVTSQGENATPIWGPAGAYAKGVVSYNTNTTVTHGLGSTPTKIVIKGFTTSVNGSYRNTISEGIAIISSGTIQNSVCHSMTCAVIEVTPSNNLATNTTTGIVGTFGFQGSGTVTLSNVNSTTFTLTISGGSEATITHNDIWECYA